MYVCVHVYYSEIMYVQVCISVFVCVCLLCVCGSVWGGECVCVWQQLFGLGFLLLLCVLLWELPLSDSQDKRVSSLNHLAGPV